MARRPNVNADVESVRAELEGIVRSLEADLRLHALRERVRSLLPAFHKLRDLGASLVPVDVADDTAARERIRLYFVQYSGVVLDSDELLVVSGIQEYARRIRELRVEFGWAIVSGKTVRAMVADGEIDSENDSLIRMRPDQYILLRETADREAAFRWNVANEIRKSRQSVQSRLLNFFRRNVGAEVTIEELRYIAKDASEWARRVRELRTEQGWPILTRYSGRPDLPSGVYVLEADRQSPEHDRVIDDKTRRQVLRRDGYSCSNCGWKHDEHWNRSDPRHLELHHVTSHVEGGANSEDNLITLCTVCHDDLHSGQGQARRGVN